MRVLARHTLDISRDLFDGDKPICLDIGTPIVELLGATATPPNHSIPKLFSDGSRLTRSDQVSFADVRLLHFRYWWTANHLVSAPSNLSCLMLKSVTRTLTRALFKSL